MNYEEYISEAEAEIAKLLEDRQRIDARISLLKSFVQNCRQLGGIGVIPGMPIGQSVVPGVSHNQLTELINQVRTSSGITKAIRQVLENSKVPLSAPEIRAELESLGAPLSEYVNAGAVIHNTLTRLVKQGEVQRIVEQDGQTVYALVRFKQFVEHIAGGVGEP